MSSFYQLDPIWWQLYLSRSYVFVLPFTLSVLFLVIIIFSFLFFFKPPPTHPPKKCNNYSRLMNYQVLLLSLSLSLSLSSFSLFIRANKQKKCFSRYKIPCPSKTKPTQSNSGFLVLRDLLGMFFCVLRRN